MLRQCLIWVCSCPRQLRGSHRSITEVSTTELAYAPLWSSAISINKILSRKNLNWLQSRLPRLLRHMRNRPNITSFQSKSQSKTSSTKARRWNPLDFKRRIYSRLALVLRRGDEREDELSVIPGDMIPSEGKVEWSKSPSGSVEEIEAKSSIQPFARSPLSPRIKGLFSKWTEPRYHIHQRETAISLGCTPL